MSIFRRGPYKRYLQDPTVAIPRRTRSHWENNPNYHDQEMHENQAFEESESDFNLNAPEYRSTVSTSDDISDGYTSDSSASSSDDNGCVDNSSRSEFIDTPINNEGDAILYEGSEIFVSEAITMIMTIFMKHSLSRECLEDLLKMISALLPSQNAFPQSKFKLFKILQGYVKGVVQRKEHYYCTVCQYYLGSAELAESVCCPACSANCKRSECGIFFELSIEDSLKHLLEKQHIYKYLDYPFTRAKKHHENYEDIIDGKEYLKLNLNEMQDNIKNISFVWNTDGVPIFKSSLNQLWPIQCTIIEPPPHLRKKYSIVAGLWYGKCKPLMEALMKPFCDSLRKLGTTGMKCSHPVTDQVMTTFVYAPLASVDAVARAALQNIHQFNGDYGCSFCEHPGMYNGQKMVYPPDGEQYLLRTNRRMLHQSAVALERDEIFFGVKGPSCLVQLPKFDAGKGFSSEYMHSGLLGTTRMFGFAWFDSSNHDKAWYLGRHIDEVDEALLQIKPPNDVTRTPRSISQRAYWKASEWRLWLLFYSIPVLTGILKKEYLQHFMLLVMGTYILLEESISKDKLKLADSLLNLFVDNVKLLYGLEFCTFNVHQLTYLTLSVKRWGPLWCHSAFHFESCNGTLKRLVKGTQAVAKQLSHIIELNFALSVVNNHIPYGTLGSFLIRQLQSSNKHHSETGSQFLGRPAVLSKDHEYKIFLKLHHCLEGNKFHMCSYILEL